MDYQEEINLINFFTRNKNLTRGQRIRFEHLLARDINGFQPKRQNIENHNHEQFDKERNYFNPLTTAEFLSLLGARRGLKYLTHDFQPDSDMTMEVLIDQVKSVLEEWYGKIPKSLYLLIKGFVFGEKWLNCYGKEQRFFLSSDQMKAWYVSNPKSNPIISTEHERFIQDFRSTVRLSKPQLDELVAEISNNKNIQLTTKDLQKADFYTNVFYLRRIINWVINDVIQRERNPKISISYERSSLDDIRRCSIKIVHHDSEANLFDDVWKKVTSDHGGGSLRELLQLCVGYCDWTIDANFEDVSKRWRIINHTDNPEFEDLDNEKPEGFTHIFTFYKKLD